MNQSLKEFMTTYDGFDWKNGQLVLVIKETGKAYIITEAYAFVLQRHLDDVLYSWTHTKDIMVITVK